MSTLIAHRGIPILSRSAVLSTVRAGGSNRVGANVARFSRSTKAATFTTWTARRSVLAAPPAPPKPSSSTQSTHKHEAAEDEGSTFHSFQRHRTDGASIPPPASSLPLPSHPVPSGTASTAASSAAVSPVEAIHWEDADVAIWHPVYSESEVESVQVVHLPTQSLSDKIALFFIKASRKGFDFVTGYKHASPEEARAALEKAGLANAPLNELREKGFVMTVPQWMVRILFLETIAGIPGMVGGILRHLQSLRLLRRDGGWINTLLEEAENERMHLLTFLKIKEPSVIFRLAVLAAQGIYFNAFFVLYMISPKTAHRFVGYLEEEAVVTYTQVVDEIKRGNLPEWSDGPDVQKVPQMAKDYWRLKDDCTMLDLVLAVRADEAGHRFVNHTLSSLDQKVDQNPFALRHPPAQLQGALPGLTREESLEWSKKLEEDFHKARQLEAKHSKGE